MAMMRWAGLAAMLLLLCAPLAHAQQAQIHPALFVARDADSTIYLFGSVHVRRAGAPWGGPEAQAALASASDVWTEMDVSPDSEARAQRIVAQLGAAPAGRPLSSFLTEAEAARLQAIAKRADIPVALLERMRPWLAAITLSFAPIMQAGYDPASGVDRAIDAAAEASGKRMHAFETAEQQIQFVANLSDPMQREMLLDTISEVESGPAELDELMRAWEAGDLPALERVVIDDVQANYPELYDALFRRRNAAWVAQIMRRMDGAGVEFIAVGAGHLVGADGLIAQLQARGVSVERVAAR